MRGVPGGRTTLVAAGLVAAGFLLLYRGVLLSLVEAWWGDGNYSHGFLIVPISAYLAWERRERFLAAPSRPEAAGLAVIAGSFLVLMAGVLGAELFLTRVSVVGTLAGIILFLFGWVRLRVLAFPLAILLLMIPLPAIVFNQVAFPLQLLASRVGELSLTAVDIPVLRDGNVLVLGSTELEVAAACSGIRSLVSLLTLGIVLGYFVDRRAWARTLIALSCIPVAIVANGARVAGTGIMAHWFGADAATGFFHWFEGWVVFGVALLMMLSLQRVVTRLAPGRAR